VNAHGLHSPFLYNLYKQVIEKKDKRLSNTLEEIRNYVFTNKNRFNYTDPKTNKIQSEVIGTWSRRVTSSKKFSHFLIHLVNWLEIQTVVETGTAAAINATSLSLSNAQSIITIEGSREIAKIAENTIAKFGNKRVTLINQNVFHCFRQVLSENNPDLIFLDADHRSATLKFYLDAINKMELQPKCILIHDINWSKEMNGAWISAANDSKYPLTVDLFEVGLIFPRIEMQKQHFVIRF
jgi:predicted O-methyltransferase YrrM